MSAPAGYSGTPQPKKLGIKDGHTVALIDAADHIVDLLDPLPDNVRLRTSARGKPDVSLVFCHRRRDLERRLEQLWMLAFPDRSVWVCTGSGRRVCVGLALGQVPCCLSVDS